MSKCKKDMKDGILIIGGGLLQIPALIKAHELGLTTHLTDINSKCAARDYCDYFYEVDINDYEKTADLAVNLVTQNKISGVYTQGTDAEYTVAYAAEKAKLFTIGATTARKSKNKALMRDALSEAGVENVKYKKISCFDECLNAAEEVGYPLYMKPTDNSASRGISRVSNAKELKDAYDFAEKNLLNESDILLEAEIIGTEHSVDCVMFNGILYPAGISDRVFLEKNIFAVQTESITPSLLPSKIQKEMYEKMEMAADAIGIRFGAFKGDLVVDSNNNVRIIEITARTSGGFDSQYRKPLSFGIDILKATIDISMGKKLDVLDLIPKHFYRSKTYSLMPQPGKITSIEGLEEARKIEGVYKIFMTKNIGDIIPEYKDCSIRTNFITICAKDSETLRKIQEQVHKTFKIKTSQD
ncbi:MAG: ATP-grasp domain-containing protein [SAR86 cluster bacterium]|nr:ATP-grasp domain-containing protein [SAR86 cluster bacterium]